MHPIKLTPIRIATALLASSLFVAGCSSSSSTDTEPTVNDSVASGEIEPVNGINGTTTGVDMLDDGSANGANGDTSSELEPDNTDTSNPNQSPDNVNPINQDTAATNPTNPNPAVPDPMTPISTNVMFDIQVPAYQSDELKVGVAWGDNESTASWVGDEFWSVTDEFLTNTENLLVVTFYDGNGDVTLGSFEQTYKTGINATETFKITADQFDTDRWDSDGNGVSNLDQLIAGTGLADSPRVLLFSETRDFRHDSTEVAVDAIAEIATSAGMQADHAGDSAGVFTESNLANYDAVVWVMTSGDVLDANEQVAFENFIRAGGGYAGIHAASFTEYEWPWYGALVGAYFDAHPAIQSATQVVEDSSHPSTAHLNLNWTRTDEWYDYRSNPRAQVNVLLSLDENSYSGGKMGDDHPSAWYHDYDGGRSWYTGGGHTDSSYAEADFRAHLLGGLNYVVGSDGS